MVGSMISNCDFNSAYLCNIPNPTVRVNIGQVIWFSDCPYVVAGFSTHAGDLNLILRPFIGNPDSVEDINEALKIRP
jgi:hypothetical protein